MEEPVRPRAGWKDGVKIVDQEEATSTSSNAYQGRNNSSQVAALQAVRRAEVEAIQHQAFFKEQGGYHLYG